MIFEGVQPGLLYVFVPQVEDSLHTLPCHGDGLSVERMGDAKKARVANRTALERLEGLEQTSQEFHFRGINLQVNMVELHQCIASECTVRTVPDNILGDSFSSICNCGGSHEGQIVQGRRVVNVNVNILVSTVIAKLIVRFCHSIVVVFALIF